MHTPATKHGQIRHLPTKHDRTEAREIVKLDDKMEAATIMASWGTLHETVISRSQQKIMQRHQVVFKKISKLVNIGLTLKLFVS